MQKTDFNRDWTVQKDGSTEILHVNLPDDAMIREERSKEANIFTLKFSIFRKMKPDRL